MSTSEIVYEDKLTKIVKKITYTEEFEKIKINDMIKVKESNISRINEQLESEQKELDDLLAIKNK